MSAPKPGAPGPGEVGPARVSAAPTGAPIGAPPADATAPAAPHPIRFQLEGREVEALPGESILQVAERHGVRIPHLCFMEGMRADGNCRACVVEIEGERVLAPSCWRKPTPGMKVSATSARARASQRMVLELLLADMPEEVYRPDSELLLWARELGVHAPRFPRRKEPAPDLSHPAIAVHLDACIQCTRCVRACREVQVNDVIGYAWRGADAFPVFDLDDPMGLSTCVACGECVQACPTGALLPRLVWEHGVAGEVDLLSPLDRSFAGEAV